jgi:hypothetical protein
MRIGGAGLNTKTTFARRSLAILGMTAIAFGAFGGMASAADQPPGGDGGTSFGLSTPAENVALHPGEKTDTWIQISNQLDKPVDYTIMQVTMVPQDEGHFNVVDQPDPSWNDHLSFPSQVTVGPKNYVKVPIHIDMPADAKPDIYLVGFAVQPITNTPSSGIAVKNRIAHYISVEVPGARTPKITVHVKKMKSFILGNTLAGSFKMRNEGATTTVRGQVRVNTWKGKNVSVVQATGDDPLLLPRGAGRTASYKWKASGLFFLGRANLEVGYPNGTATPGVVNYKGPLMLVVPKAALAVPVVLVLLVIVALYWRRMRHKLAAAHEALARVPAGVATVPAAAAAMVSHQHQQSHSQSHQNKNRSKKRRKRR